MQTKGTKDYQLISWYTRVLILQTFSIFITLIFWLADHYFHDWKSH